MATLVHEYRGDFLENVHDGHLCGVNDKKEIQYAVGDPYWITFMRSAAKPFQALPTLRNGYHHRFNFTAKEITLMAASHRAMPYHVEALQSMIEKLHLTEQELVCKPTYPLHAETRDMLIANHGPARKIYHNCSGKHIGLIAYCKAQNLSLEHYESIDHPAQQDVLNVLSYLTECPKEKMTIGVDGCGLPVFAIPLHHMAIGFLKLACPDLIEDVELAKAVTVLTDAMNQHPTYISSPDLICANLMMDNNIVAKGGANGTYCFALKKERLAFAFKVLDGSEDEWPLIVASILEQINYSKIGTIQRMYNISQQYIINDNDRVVGESKTVFQLSSMH